jgi:nucleoside-diphosphate-sugar epimerase/glycosyltransferase involved in cell wall biosynthesis
MSESIESKIQQLQGPILVLGASGFIGANLLRMLLRHRSDVFGTSSRPSAWRLEGIPEKHVIATDLLVEVNLRQLLGTVRPRTVFNCVAYGAYSFEKNTELIYRTNLNFTSSLIERLREAGVAAYIHAGSSSEYGDNAAAPPESSAPTPNSHYAVSKAAASELIYYSGKKLGFPCANLRLYSIYGPLEDASRLIPALVSKALQGSFPPLVDPEVSRDFVYVDDACEAFVDAALRLTREDYGESFNIGSGVKTSIQALARLGGELFQVKQAPNFTSMPRREWDVTEWVADPSKAKRLLGWAASTPLGEGLKKTAQWYQGLKDPESYHRISKRFGIDEVYSVSAVIACYKDGQAIPIMYQRLKDVFERLQIGYEIIFVNDNSPDDSEEVIRGISARDRNVLGISHSRNFGSQAAFRSGMEASTKNACVLLDGDLQDPPELIEQFVTKWKEGYEVVYGRRVKREASFLMQLAYKLFYKVFDRFSYISIPADAGDFSLIEKKVVRSLLSFPERDLFLRGIRAFAGFKQVGVDYVRPKRMFGITTNNFLKNVGWAKKGILSFSYLPLNLLSFFGVAIFLLFSLLAALQVYLKWTHPDMAPKGLTSTILIMVFFGSINFLALSLVGEYIAKILEEVKHRPHFIRRNIVRDGEIRQASDESQLSRSTGYGS